MERKIKVGIVDDNPSLTEGLTYFLEDNNLACAFAVNSKIQFFEEMDKHLVDVVLVDVIMPNVVGLDLFEYLQEQHPQTPVIVYSNIRNIQLINDLFRIPSVRGMVAKNENLNVVLERITQVVVEEKKVFPKELLNTNEGEISLKLSERELEVLYLLAEGLSSKTIGEKLDISENTVLYHRKKLFKVFNTSNLYHLIVEAKECGFLS